MIKRCSQKGGTPIELSNHPRGLLTCGSMPDGDLQSLAAGLQPSFIHEGICISDLCGFLLGQEWEIMEGATPALSFLRLYHKGC